MKISIDVPVKDFSDKVVEFQETIDNVTTNVPFTFRKVIEITLSQENPNSLTAEKKQQAYQIGIKLLSGKKRESYDLTTDQVAFLKERIGVMYGAVVYGRFLELIGDLKAEVESE